MSIVLDIYVKALTGLIGAFGLPGPRHGGNPLYRPQDALDDVAPMRVHVQDQPAATGLLIVPAWPLRLGLDAIEDPPAKFNVEPDDAAEETAIHKLVEFSESRQKQLVLDRTVLQALGLDSAQQAQSVLHRGGNWFFCIDMLAGSNCPLQQVRPQVGDRRIEEDRIAGVFQRGIQIR